MRTADFDFDLPPDRIADQPARPRDAARLLHVGRSGGGDAFTDHIVRDLPGLLNPGDLLVYNDTRVIPARLSGRRGEVRVEVTLHKREGADTWHAFAKPGKRLRVGDAIAFAPDLSAEVRDKREGGDVELRFSVAGSDLMAALHRHGVMPLPPYIAALRAPDEADRQDYQTVWARRSGAVAAPTASLHFDEPLLAALRARGVRFAHVTLHVGAGTFLPVKVKDVTTHKMHGEWGEVTPEAAAAINETRAAGGRVIPVGTTALRLIESAATPDGRVQPFRGVTEIFIYPGYRFRVTDGLMTNFHLPRSTLLMLVSALMGQDRIRRIYRHAVDSGYRFFSYGDASLLVP